MSVLSNERLTERHRTVVCCPANVECTSICDDCDHMGKMMDKLAEYEDLEEQGLLLRLPCKVGDTFWELNENTEPPYVYPRIAHRLQHCIYALERLGKTTFLTQSEAEEKLRELEGIKCQN